MMLSRRQVPSYSERIGARSKGAGLLDGNMFQKKFSRAAVVRAAAAPSSAARSRRGIPAAGEILDGE
jgi:hypothetical protein